jgi:hypothetical protein
LAYWAADHTIIAISLIDGFCVQTPVSGNGCAITPECQQNNGLRMLSFRDAAISNAERNHYSIHEQVSPQLWNAHTATG